MDGRDEMDLAPDGSVRVQRACDSCRGRKIRCDRGTPCSNCRASNLTCRTTSAAQRIQKQRIHVSDEYEKKIDRIEQRLSGIEDILERLATKLDSMDNPADHIGPRTQAKNTNVRKSPRPAGEMTPPSPAPFEGETALNAQSEYAREFIEKAVHSTPSIVQNKEVQAALASLKSMVNRHNIYGATKSELQPLFDKVTADVDASTLERPPWEAINDVIEKATLYPTMSFAVVFPYLKLHNMKQLFRDVCDAPNETPTGRRILVFGILYNLFTEFSSYPAKDDESEKLRLYSYQTKLHLEAAISKLDLFIPATYENIVALLIASSYAVELCKPSFCWLMTSTAAGLCQRLGYHRSSSMKDDTPDERAAKVHIFWFIYIMDKTLSLQLGRSSAIQDWDISLPYPGMSDGQCHSVGLTHMQRYWISLARTQGETYEQLFSPAAFLKPENERVQIVNQLVQRLNQAWSNRGVSSLMDATLVLRGWSILPEDKRSWWASRKDGSLRTLPEGAEGSSLGESYPGESMAGSKKDLFYYSDAVAHLSTITLIHRAIQPANAAFSAECLHAAREALRLHQICSEQFNVKDNEDAWSCYLHWTILQSPFTPFIVLFCNAISTSSHTDLRTLSGFVTSLESSRTVSEGGDRVYKMCQLFLLVAKLCVEARSQERANSVRTGATPAPGFYPEGNVEPFDYSGLNQIDPYLSALGLVPNASGPLEGLPPMQNGAEYLPQEMPTFGDATQSSLQNWFSGSRYIMGLMEDNFSMPDMPDINF